MICCLSGYLMSSVFKQRNMVLYLPIRISFCMFQFGLCFCFRLCHSTALNVSTDLTSYILVFVSQTMRNIISVRHTIVHKTGIPLQLCLLFCINHWKNCIVWHQTQQHQHQHQQQQQRKLIAYGRRRRIIHLAHCNTEKKINQKEDKN